MLGFFNTFCDQWGNCLYSRINQWGYTGAIAIANRTEFINIQTIDTNLRLDPYNISSTVFNFVGYLCNDASRHLPVRVYSNDSDTADQWANSISNGLFSICNDMAVVMMILGGAVPICCLLGCTIYKFRRYLDNKRAMDDRRRRYEVLENIQNPPTAPLDSNPFDHSLNLST